MPKLRQGERMQRCEFEDHSRMRSQKYYIVRTYYSELENHFCQTCIGMLRIKGLVDYTVQGGYVPIERTNINSLLNIYGKGVKQNA